jgi:choline kinase
VTPVLDPRFAEGNGLSVLAARELLDAEERFLLVMADHVLDPRLLTDLVATKAGPRPIPTARSSPTPP